jgi:hypothetical protein
MSYSSYSRGLLLKWIGIFIILLIFIPIFSYNTSMEPIWAYLVYINWEKGLKLNQYAKNQFNLAIYLAIMQFIFGSMLALLGNIMASEFKSKIMR